MAARKVEPPITSTSELIARSNKKYPGTLIKGSDLKGLVVPRVTTGSLSFDQMLGGGWPVNQWNELIGNESNGKTVMALKSIAANMAIDPDYTCLWVASEEFVPDWAEQLGVDLSRIILAATNVMEEAYQITVDALGSQTLAAVVIDSLPALVPGEEAEKSMAEFAVGLGARLTGKFMRKSSKAQRRSLVHEERPCLALIINQWREKIGITFGDPRTTPGGKAKNFHYFTRVELARDKWLFLPGTEESKDKIRVGLTIKGRTIKNKTAPPQRVGMADFYFSDVPGTGLRAGEYDTAREVFEMGVAYDVVQRTNNTYSWNGSVLGTSRDKAAEAVRGDLTVQREIHDAIEAIITAPIM